MYYDGPVDCATFGNEKPWNFLTAMHVTNSRRAFDALSERYSKSGFTPPCQFSGTIEYPHITWKDEPVYSIIFELPDAESDLRYNEIPEY